MGDSHLLTVGVRPNRSQPAVRPAECVSAPAATELQPLHSFRRLAMRACSALVPVVLLGALLGCNRFNSGSPGNGNQNGSDPSLPDAKEQNLDVSALYALDGPAVPPPRATRGRRTHRHLELLRAVRRPAAGLGGGRGENRDHRQPALQRAQMAALNGSSLAAEPIVYDPAKPHPSIVFTRATRKDCAVLKTRRERLSRRRSDPVHARRPDDHHQTGRGPENPRGIVRGASTQRKTVWPTFGRRSACTRIERR